ncbi:MAG TPA: hypothetical protein VFG10_20135 [Saprospiraceae bacterium]|nr:hypothetical protein [Saprospiraceae bacterium]
MKFLLIILGLLDLGLLFITISLWRSSHFPGAEIGNLDSGLAKIAGGAFLVVSVSIIGILYFRK